MLNNDETPTPRQIEQTAMGQYLALSAAVHALIESHPHPAAFARRFDDYDQLTQKVFLQRETIQKDDGARQAFSEVRASLIGAIPKH